MPAILPSSRTAAAKPRILLSPIWWSRLVRAKSKQAHSAARTVLRSTINFSGLKKTSARRHAIPVEKPFGKAKRSFNDGRPPVGFDDPRRLGLLSRDRRKCDRGGPQAEL